MDPLLLKDVAHACWEAIQLAVVDFRDTRAACARDDKTVAGGRHGHRSDTRYALVKSTFLNLFSSGFGQRTI